MNHCKIRWGLGKSRVWTPAPPPPSTPYQKFLEPHMKRPRGRLTDRCLITVFWRKTILVYMHIGSLASSHIGLISQRQIGSLARLFFIPCYLKREITYNSDCEMHVSHLPHKLFTIYQKQMRTQPKLFEKACFLCCVIVCVRRRNEDCIAL